MPERSRARPPFGLVLFDLDGTLVDTAPDIADAVNAALADHGLPRVGDLWVRNRIGNGTRTLLRQAVSRDTDLDPLVASFERHYATRCGKRGHLYPEAASTLTTLRNAGVRLALVTNKEARHAAFVLQVHGLDAAFDVRVFGDTLPVKKPSPEVVRYCLRTMRLTRRRALLVGDSAIDVRTARAAGIPVWAVTHGYNGGRPIEEEKPDRVLAGLQDLLEPLAQTVQALADQSPRASSRSRYFRSNPRN